MRSRPRASVAIVRRDRSTRPASGFASHVQIARGASPCSRSLAEDEPETPAARPRCSHLTKASASARHSPVRAAFPPGRERALATSRKDEPHARYHAGGQPGQCRQESFSRGMQAAADPQVRPMRPQRQADRPRRRMQGKMRDQMRRRAPHALGHEAAQGTARLARPRYRDAATTPQSSNRSGGTPMASIAVKTAAVAGDRLLVGIAEQRRWHPRPALRNWARASCAGPARRPASSGTVACPTTSPASSQSAPAWHSPF